MAIFKPFRALRPTGQMAERVAALPYDTMNSAEAREKVKDNPYSFIHVDKAEVDLDESIDIYDKSVYQKAKENLLKLENDGILVNEKKPCFYVYRQIMGEQSQTGLVGLCSIDDYLDGTIKKHELTREDKEQDRIRHVDTTNANTGPIFLAYRENKEIAKIIDEVKNSCEPLCDFFSEGVQNTVWIVDDEEKIVTLSDLFEKNGALYIADGHHRCASAVKVGQMRREQNPNYDKNAEFNFFLSVAFSKDELKIMDYNRVIKDTAGLGEKELLNKISEKFDVKKAEKSPYRPKEPHTFGMLLGGEWFVLTAKDGTFDKGDVISSLDVSILQNNLIEPIFGISDPRTDPRIDFVGGIRGLGELEKRCNADAKVAFSMFPTSLSELMSVADAGQVMPPKSTWFEPKLLSGLFIHKL